MTGRRAFIVACTLQLAGCGSLPAGAPGGMAPHSGLAGSLLREDRVTITRGTEIHAVGVSRRWVYAVTADAIIVYDRDRRGWLPPFTREAGFDPALVRAVAIDPDDDGAWLLTDYGAWTLQPLTAFVGRAPAGALPARLRVASLDAVYREFPSLQAFAGALARDAASLQGFPVTAGSRAPDRTEVWLGTAGGGLLQVDPLFNAATPQPFGLATSGAGAIARAADGVWIAPAPRPGDTRLALTFTSRDLQQWRWLDDDARRGFGGARATALDVRNGTLWMGTTRGLLRVSVNGHGARAFTPMSGLPGDLVLAVLARADGIWVGTSRGLAWLPPNSTGDRDVAVPQGAVADVPVNALLATGDTLWVGTDAGLLLRTPGAAGKFVRPGEAPATARLRQPVRALARSDSLVFVALRDAVLAFDLHAGAWRDAWPAAPWRSVGDIEVAAADARSVWVGGALGVLAVDRATGASRNLRSGSDLPDAVTGLVLDGPCAWIATLGGVVRVRRSADGLIP